jgi:Putative adhesin
MKAGILGLSTLLLSGCMMDFGESDRYKEDFHKTFDVDSGAMLSVENFNGAIEISGTDGHTVDVSGTKYANTKESLNELRVDMTGSSSSVRIRTERPDFWNGGGGVRYTIRVPKKMVLDRIQSSNGRIQVEDIDGSARLHTSNGEIRASDIKGELNAETSNGRIEIRGLSGNANLRTSNGPIDAEASHGRIEARTSNGKIDVRLSDASPDNPILLETSNGHVELRLDGKQVPDVRARSTNSAIVLYLPASANARVRAHTTGGSIRSDFDGVSDDRKSHHSHDAEGTIGSGGRTLDLETRNGSIELLKR